MAQIEFDWYIPSDVTINDDGTIDDMSNVYVFDDQDSFFLRSFTGFGMPPIEYITQRGPFQYGRSVLDYRLQPRIIQLVHRRLACNRTGYWDNRSDLIDKLRPNRQFANSFEPGRLRKILPDGTVRDIKVLIERGPRFNPRSQMWDEYAFQETLRFIAHDPIVFDPALQNAIWALGNLENLIFFEAVNWTDRLVFEGDSLFSGGIWFGETSLGDVLNITYTGTWLANPTILISGPLNSPQILNNTTVEKIKLDYNVSVGETVTINLEYGQKTIVNNASVNLIGTAAVDSDISTFHIAPDPEAPGGINELQVFGDGAVVGATEVKIQWNTNYIGI